MVSGDILPEMTVDRRPRFVFITLKMYVDFLCMNVYFAIKRKHSITFRTLIQEVKKQMNKSDLITHVSEATELSKKDVTKAVDAVFEAISEALQSGDKVQLVGFGNFEVRERSARKGRNPQTGEEIEIPASKIPAFKPGKALKDGIK